MYKYEIELNRSPLSVGEPWERKDRRKVTVTLESDKKESVYLGIQRAPVDQGEADRVSLTLNDLLIVSDDLFLDPLTAHRLGKALIDAAEFAGLTDQQIRDAAF